MEGRERQPVPVPAPVLAGLEAVRRSGICNMLDRRAVQYVAHQRGYHAAVLWIEDHPGDYAAGIFGGFVAEPVLYNVLQVYPSGDSRIVERGLSREHAEGMARHLDELGEFPECHYEIEAAKT